MKKYSVLLAAGVAALSSGALAQDESSGVYCSVQFHQTDPEEYYYVHAGEDFYYVTWAPGASERDVAKYEKFVRQLYGKQIAAANSASYSSAMSGAVLGDVTCEHIQLAGETRWGRSWGKTSITIDKAIIDRMFRRPSLTWMLDDRVDFGAMGKSLPEKAKPKEASKEPSPRKPSTEQSAPSGPTAAEIAAERHRAVEERNRAAQAQYEADLAEQQRKVDEFNRLTKEMERKKAEQQAEAQRALDSFKAEQAVHAQQMSRHQQEVSDYQNQLAQQGSKGPATGGRRQATGAIVDSREAAMAALMRLPVPSPLTDIQCGEVKMYSPPKWTCWGFYQSDTKPTGASAQ